MHKVDNVDVEQIDHIGFIESRDNPEFYFMWHEGPASCKVVYRVFTDPLYLGGLMKIRALKPVVYKFNYNDGHFNTKFEEWIVKNKVVEHRHLVKYRQECGFFKFCEPIDIAKWIKEYDPQAPTDIAVEIVS